MFKRKNNTFEADYAKSLEEQGITPRQEILDAIDVLEAVGLAKEAEWLKNWDAAVQKYGPMAEIKFEGYTRPLPYALMDIYCEIITHYARLLENCPGVSEEQAEAALWAYYECSAVGYRLDTGTAYDDGRTL